MSIPPATIDRTLTAITSICTDLRGFSTLHSDLTPVALAELLDTYYHDMAAIVDEERGRVDTFLGDSVLAHFTTSVDDRAGAETRAVDAALRMKAVVTARWPAIPMSVGIATGEAVVGHFGPPRYRFYTAFGDVVSRAVALERRSHVTGFTVLIDRRTRDGLADRITVTPHNGADTVPGPRETIFEVPMVGVTAANRD